MPEENYQKIKLLKIMEILRQEADEEPPMTKVELAARLVAMNVSCSPRSLIRDIKLLNEQGYEIMERLIGHEKGYFQRVKKVFDFFARFKNATFFVKTGFHEKSRYARQKA